MSCPLAHGVTHFSQRLPSYVQAAEHGRGWIGHLVTRFHLQAWVFVTLALLGVPFPLLWALWVTLVDFVPMIGGALAGIPTVLFALGHSLTAGIVTAAAFIIYQEIENHVLNPVVMSRTANVNPLLVLLSLLVGTSIGDWVGGFFGSLWGLCWPSRLRAPSRSSPGNCGKPARGRNSARENDG